MGVRDSRASSTGENRKMDDGAGAAKPQVLVGEASREVRRRESLWKRFRKHRLALIGLIILVTLASISLVGPSFLEHSPNATNLQVTNEAPSRDHLLGTDRNGRDVLSRLLHAGRISLSVGVSVAFIAVVVGMVIGSVAGFFGGWIDTVLMRFVDVVLSFPTILIVITIIAMIGPGLGNLIVAMGLLAWPPVARLLRAEFLSLRERDYILAARSIGVPGARVVLRHLVPNAMAPVIVAATFGVAQAILLEAGLSFLGLGIQRPTASWGNMLSEAQSLTVLASMPWLWIPPGVMITLAILAINFMGDGLRDALDPRSVSR
jgi:peptide/nickel transport system permease protein